MNCNRPNPGLPNDPSNCFSCCPTTIHCPPGVQGPEGSPGPQGSPGLPGPQGPIGPTGTIASAVGGRWNQLKSILTIAPGTEVIIPLPNSMDTVNLDLPNDDATLRITQGGVYLVSYAAYGFALQSGNVSASVRRNGMFLLALELNRTINVGDPLSLFCGSATLNLAVGDVLDLVLTSAQSFTFALETGYGAQLLAVRLA